MTKEDLLHPALPAFVEWLRSAPATVADLTSLWAAFKSGHSSGKAPAVPAIETEDKIICSQCRGKGEWVVTKQKEFGGEDCYWRACVKCGGTGRTAGRGHQ